MVDINTLFMEVVCHNCMNSARRLEYNPHADATLGRCPTCKEEVEL